MSREGPPVAKLDRMDTSSNPTLQIIDNGLTINNNSDKFETLRGNVKVKSGKWFYEVKLVTNGLLQIGWITDAFQPKTTSGSGVGDDANSWAIDGSRQYKWHNGSSMYGEYWYTGDQIGVALDLDAKKMHFYRNGRDLGAAFEGFDAPTGVWPAITISKKQKITINFGKVPFAFPPPGDQEFKGLHCFLTEKELEDLNKLFNKYKSLGISLSESGETGDTVKGQGFLEYGKALGIQEDNDIGLMILAWKFGAKEQWEFHRDEFVGGWTGYGCATIEKMKSKLQEWRTEVAKSEVFKKFYYFVFDYLKEDRKTVLSTEDSLTVWVMIGLDKKWALWPKWKEFLEKSQFKAISRDTWRQFYDFTEIHAKSVDDYDAMGSWPTMMDSFVDFMKTGQVSED